MLSNSYNIKGPINNTRCFEIFLCNSPNLNRNSTFFKPILNVIHNLKMLDMKPKIESINGVVVCYDSIPFSILQID